MTDAELDAIEARANAATLGPWYHDSYCCVFSEPIGIASAKACEALPRDAPESAYRGIPEAHVCSTLRHRHRKRGEMDANFIAAARQDVPALVAEVRRLRETLALINQGARRTDGKII